MCRSSPHESRAPGVVVQTRPLRPRSADAGHGFQPWETPHIAARARFPDELAVAHDDGSPYADVGYGAAQLPPLIDTEIRVAQVVGRLDGPLPIEIHDNEVAVRARLE